MASLVWNNELNPNVDLLNIYFNKIDDCIRYISEDIFDLNKSCDHTTDLIGQLEQLCQLQFMYEEQLLDGMKYPFTSELKDIHRNFIDTFAPFKPGSAQCHSMTFIQDFIKLRLDLLRNMNIETMKIFDFIINSYA